LDNSRPRVHNAGHHFFATIMKFLFDIFPVLLFFLAFKIWVSTPQLRSPSPPLSFRSAGHGTPSQGGQHVVGKPRDHRVFGGATLWLHDDTFIKWKLRCYNWFSAASCSVRTYFPQEPDPRHDGQADHPSRPVWQKLSLSWIVFFALMGAANLYVAFPFAESFCANEVSAKAACENDVWVNSSIRRYRADAVSSRSRA